MDTNALFIEAAAIKLRFQTGRGALMVEDLWDLPLTSTTGKINLNDLALKAYHNIEKTPKISFVGNTTSGSNLTDELRLEIIKYVIDAKQKANKITQEASAKAEEKRKLLALIQRKQENALESLTEEELVERLNKL